MDTTAHLRHLESDAAAVAGACRAGSDAPVLGCPGWDVADLVEHVGRVHRWVVRSFAETDPTQRVPFTVDGDPSPGADLAAWYEDRAAELLSTFAATDHDRVVSTFTGPQPATWWMRRQAHETSVHRWDAQRAHGTPEPIDALLASDGIDEYLSAFLPRWRGKLGHVGGSVHLHCTDVAGEWLVRFDGDAPTVERAHAKGDVAARGPAEQLLLMMWGRVPAAELDVVGDTGVLDRWLTTINVV